MYSGGVRPQSDDDLCALRLVLARNDAFWGAREPWERHVRKEIPNDASRVAQLAAGQLDLITRVPDSDIAALKRDPKLTVARLGGLPVRLWPPTVGNSYARTTAPARASSPTHTGALSGSSRSTSVSMTSMSPNSVCTLCSRWVPR